MFGFFKGMKDFSFMSNSFELAHQLLQEIMPQIEHSVNRSNFYESFIVLAYICRAGILDRFEKHEWPLTSSILVPSISNKNVTIFVAISKTVSVVQEISSILGIHEEVADVMSKGESFYVLERKISAELKNKLGL